MSYSKIMPPLCLASYNGDLAEVKRIFQTMGAPDPTILDDYSTVEFLGESGTRPIYLRKMTPLFAAALKKHSSVVQYLIENGADVSTGTLPFDSSTDFFGGLSPLHAAFLKLPTLSSTQMTQQVDIIRQLVESGANPSALSSTGLPIWMMDWTLLYQTGLELNWVDWPGPNLSALSLLIEHGMNVTQPCSYLGRTLLHHLAGPARTEDVNFIDILIAKGADLTVRDKEGIAPIMSAAIGKNQMPNIPVLEHLLKIKDLPVIDKIEALEMAAAMLLSREDSDHHSYAFNFLARANELRIKENRPRTPEISIDVSDQLPIQQRRSEYITQSILMRFPILFSKSWGAVYRHLWISIKEHYYTTQASSYTQQQQFANLLEIFWTMLETIGLSDQSEEGIWSTTHYVTGWLVYTLDDLHKKTNFDPSFYYNSVKKSMILISATNITTQDDGWHYGDRINEYMDSVFAVISMLAQLPSDQMSQEVLNSLRTIVSKDDRTYVYGENFLLLGCQSLELATIRLLLQNGADLSATNDNGDGPLHILADLSFSHHDEEKIDAAASVLLEYEVPDMELANRGVKTAADIWHSKRREEGDLRADKDEHLPHWLKVKERDRM